MKVISNARLAWLGLLVLAVLPATALAQSTFQVANAHDFTTGDPVGGAATLIRDENSINVRLTMSGLDKKASYSVWYIIWNDPENDCLGGAGACGLGDFVNVGAVLNAGGFVTGTDGTGYMVGGLEVGTPPAGLPGRPGSMLEDSFAAEVHLLIQSHGKILVGHVDAQISVPGAFCNGVTCGDQFAVAFPPPPAP